MFNLDKKFRLEDFISAQNDASFLNGDVLEQLNKIPDNSINLIISSPPYNLGKSYEKRQDLQEYLTWQKNVLSHCVNKLKDNGSIVWQVGNYIKNGEIFPLDIYFYSILKEFDLKLRNRIIWHFEHGLHAKNRLSGRYETLLWFSKNDDYVFNLDSIRVPSKYPGKRHFKGEKKGQPSGNPLGKNPSDFWIIIQNEFENGIMEIPNVKANHIEKTIHPCQFPVELVERFVLALSNENDVVLDPFAGVGSSAIAALKHKRKSILIEKEKMYLDLAKKRILKLQDQTLKLRPLGKKIYQPKGNESVAKIPQEWQNKLF